MKTITKSVIVAFATVVWLVLSQAARAQLPSPSPDGGYPNNNTGEGTGALKSLTTGTDNTAIGFQALFKNTDGIENTAVGSGALFNNTSFASSNTAIGFQALFSNNGDFNTATGSSALFSNTTGNYNTATGECALLSNTTGSGNTATGNNALLVNRTGNENTATGDGALTYNQTGRNNTATGAETLGSTGNNNTATGFAALCGNCLGPEFIPTGSNNTATGSLALISNNADNNTATGFNVLASNTTGTQNTANGVSALASNAISNDNTAEGFQALKNSTGSNNIAVGANAGINLTTGDNNIYLAASGLPTESNTIRIGKGGVQKIAYMQGISGATVAGGVGVIVDTKGHLGTVQSSARFKDEIKPMDKASEAILALKPVTFRYKKDLDPEGIAQFGLVAEDVAKVNPDLVARDEDGKAYTVRYEAVNAMLLNEFLKAHRKVQTLEATVAQQQKQIKDLTASMQKVSERLESNATPQLVANN